MIIYFNSGAEAREASRKMHPVTVEVMEQMMALSVRQPEYLDIKDPWLDSPNWRKLSIRTA